MTKQPTGRSYSAKTIKLLFGLSGGRCAMPNCENPIVQPVGDNHDAQVLGQICHIHARSPLGPRGDGGLSDEELNSEHNLILLCAHHHAEIDTNPEKYTAERLKQIKKDHCQQIHATRFGKTSVLESKTKSFPSTVIDRQIRKDLITLSKCQFYNEFPTAKKATILGTKIIQGEYSLASDSTRASGLAWCARYLSATASDMPRAEAFIDVAKELSDDAEIHIAEAFVLSNEQTDVSIHQTPDTLQSPSSLSAQLYLIRLRNGVNAALEWMVHSQTTVSELDALGKLILLKCYLDAEDWITARRVSDSPTPADFETLPTLHHFVGLIHLLTTLPEELRTLALDTPPINAASFPFAADEAAVASLQIALTHFQQAQSAAKDLNCPKAAESSHRYSLWIRLMDQNTQSSAAAELKDAFSHAKVPLYLVGLAIQFDVAVNPLSVEREIERQVALYGRHDVDAIVAQFHLAYLRKEIDDFADYIDTHLDSLATCLAPKFLRFTQITLLATNGKKRRARAVLSDLLTSDIETSDIEKRYLVKLIDASSEEDEISLELEEFKSTNSIAALSALVNKLEANRRWESLYIYAKTLFERTRAEQDAERLAISLWNSDRPRDLHEFLTSEHYIVQNSWNLKMLFCHSTLASGDFIAANGIFAELKPRRNDRNYRNLEMTLSITVGNWNSILSITEHEYSARTERSPEELLAAASLADTVGSGRTKDLIISAAQAGNDDPHILLGAYELATRNGWEGEERVFDWFARARELSGEDGPVKEMGMEEVVLNMPKWQKAQSAVFGLVETAEVPMISTLDYLRRPLSDLLLVTAWSNLEVSQPQSRTPIPIYSGATKPRLVDLKATIGFDYSSLLVLEFLGLLDLVFRELDSIYLPHSVLTWLFAEKRSSRFHQPSRVDDSQFLQNCLANGTVTCLTPTSTVDGDLASHIGDDLAILIAEALERSSENGSQTVVVRPAPVRQIDGTNEDRVDLSPYYDVLVSCRSVVSKLKSLGVVTQSEWDRATRFLEIQEEEWESEPPIPDRAEIYLDSLAVWYFLHLGLLSKIAAAGFRLYVPATLLDTVDAMIRRHSMLRRVEQAIEHIRLNIVQGIDDGNVKVGSAKSSSGTTDQVNGEAIDLISPLFAMSRCCDFLVSDDRFFNQHLEFSEDDYNVSIVATTSIVDTLANSRLISGQQRDECFTQLRQAGILFVPATFDELDRYIASLSPGNDSLVETAELKAIRQSHLLARMSSLLQSPQELLWVQNIIEVLIRQAQDLWVSGGDTDAIRVRSNWIMDQVHVRGWAHRMGPEQTATLTRFGRLDIVRILLVRPVGLPEHLTEPFWTWVEESILWEIVRDDMEWYRELVEDFRNKVFDIVDGQTIELREQFGDVDGIDPTIAGMTLEYFPPSVRKSLLTDRKYLDRFGSSVHQILSFDNGTFRARADRLFAAIRHLLSGKSGVVVHDTIGRQWDLCQRHGEDRVAALHVELDKVQVALPNLLFLSPDVNVRLLSFQRSAEHDHLSTQARKVWEGILRQRSLTDKEVSDLMQEFQHTLGHTIGVIDGEVSSNEVRLSNLVPESRKYFDSLVGPYSKEDTLDHYLMSSIPNFFNELQSRESSGFLPLALHLSSHSQITKAIPADQIGDDDFINTLSQLCESGDRISQLGAVEVAIPLVSDRPKLEPWVIKLIRVLRDDDGIRDVGGYRFQASLFRFVECELSVRRSFTTEPPFYRRLVSLAHAGVIQRRISRSGVDIGSFCDFLERHCALRFQIQSLVDMRREPRWEPTFSEPTYLRAQFLGRIVGTAFQFRDGLKGTDIHELVLGEHQLSLQSDVQFPYWYFAGPLEGGQPLAEDLRQELILEIESQLSKDQVTPRSFTALMNSVFLGSVPPSHSKLASEALGRGRYRFKDVDDKSQLLAVLYGLARVCGNTRSLDLAESLRLVSRRYRNDRQFALSADEEFRLILMAAACVSGLDEWCEFVGMWLTELVFSNVDNDQSRRLLHMMLRVLLDIVPIMWSYCGAADAALDCGDVVE